MVVIADGVMHLEAESLFGVPVEIEEAVGPFAIHGQRVEHMVSALQDEVRLDARRLLKGHCAAMGRIEFRLKVRVGDKEKVEGAGRPLPRREQPRLRPEDRERGRLRQPGMR